MILNVALLIYCVALTFAFMLAVQQISWMERENTDANVSPPSRWAKDGPKDWLWPTWSVEKENDGSVAKPRTAVLYEPQRRSSNDCTAGRG